jgi:hypothetical protein
MLLMSALVPLESIGTNGGAWDGASSASSSRVIRRANAPK